MKKHDAALKEYAYKLSDEHLRFLVGRFTMRLGGDVPDAVSLLSENHEMDRWLASAKSSTELYDIVDTIASGLDKEWDRRGW